MQKTAFLLILVCFFCFPLIVFAENVCNRNLPDTYTAGTTFNATISFIADPNYPATGVVITENFPPGWSIVSSNPNWSKYIASSNSYKWLYFSSVPIGSFTITYTVRVPADASGQYAFSGTLNDGWTTKDIAGDTSISSAGMVNAPSFSPSPGIFYNFFPDVEITCSTQDATVRYTTDGSEPTTNSTVYSMPLHITETTLIKAKAFKEGATPSSTLEGTFTIQIQKGDINRDATVDISDVILCLRMAVELGITVDQQLYNKPYNDWLMTIADVNNDTVIDISDVILCLRIAVGLS